MQKNHRYSLVKGFIGPLTRRQTLSRDYNRKQYEKKREKRKQEGSYMKPRPYENDDPFWMWW